MGSKLNKCGINNFYISSIGTSQEQSISELLDKHSKSEIEEIMKKIGLTTFKSISLNKIEFLNNPKNYFNQLPSKLYFVEIKSSLSLEKKRSFNLNAQETLDFVNSFKHFDKVTIRENYLNIFSGTIIVSPNNKTVYIEMVKGNLTNLLHNSKLDFYAIRDDFLHTFKYNVDDLDIKKIIIKVLEHIPSPNLLYEPIDFKREFLSGYYEFIIVDKEDNHGLQPVFWDYNQNKVFTNVFR